MVNIVCKRQAYCFSDRKVIVLKVNILTLSKTAVSRYNFHNLWCLQCPHCVFITFLTYIIHCLISFKSKFTKILPWLEYVVKKAKQNKKHHFQTWRTHTTSWALTHGVHIDVILVVTHWFRGSKVYWNSHPVRYIKYNDPKWLLFRPTTGFAFVSLTFKIVRCEW